MLAFMLRHPAATILVGYGIFTIAVLRWIDVSVPEDAEEPAC